MDILDYRSTSLTPEKMGRCDGRLVRPGDPEDDGQI